MLVSEFVCVAESGEMGDGSRREQMEPDVCAGDGEKETGEDIK